MGVEKGWFILGLFLIGIALILLGFFYFFSPSDEPGQLSYTECVTIVNNGDPNEKINIVFLADNYDDVTKFSEDAERFKDALLKVPPLNSYSDLFNFFMIPQFADLGCDHDEAILCNDRKVKALARKCPSDFPIVLSDVNGVENLFKYLRSSSWRDVIAINSADNELVLPHEFAHLFADFADEYEFEGNIDWDAPNCRSDCSEFGDIRNPGCFNGCTNLERNRECENCIMRDYWVSDVYGNYNEWYFNKLLGEQVKLSPTAGEEVLVIDAIYDSGKIFIQDMVRIPGYSPNVRLRSGYVFRTNGKEFVIGDPGRIFTDVRTEDSMEGGVLSVRFTEFTVSLPIDEIGDKIEILDPDGKLIGEEEISKEIRGLEDGVLHELSAVSIPILNF